MPVAPSFVPGVMPPAAEVAAEGFRLPDFFIAGTARGGTTSLWEYLRQHPDICMPPVFEFKEPSFFCELYGMKNWREYLSLFAEGKNRKMIGEASGAYLTSPESPARLKASVPRAKFIISLRNPVERAYSKYKWMRANGYEKFETFAEALAAEPGRAASEDFKRSNGQYFYNFLYFDSGIYDRQVRRFLEAFGREQVRVLIFEEWTQRPHETLEELFRFLGVDAAFRPQIKVHNATIKDRSLDEEIPRRLMDGYQQSIVNLEKLLGRELVSVWK